MRIKIMGVSLAALLTLGGCGAAKDGFSDGAKGDSPGTAERERNERLYISEAKGFDDSGHLKTLSDQKILGYGKLFCSKMDETDDVEEAEASLRETLEVEPAAAVIAASVSELCPKHKSAVSNR